MPKYRVGRLCGRRFHCVWRGRSFAASTLRLSIAAAAVVAIVSAPVEVARAGGKALDHPRCDRDSFRVVAVLDIGHSLDAPGATSARGVPEYQFNLLLAEEVQKVLDSGFAKTVLLNTFGPARESLFRRVAAANAPAPTPRYAASIQRAPRPSSASVDPAHQGRRDRDR